MKQRIWTIVCITIVLTSFFFCFAISDISFHIGGSGCVINTQKSFLEISPFIVNYTGLVNVTYAMHNVEHLYAWQLGLLTSNTTSFVSMYIPADGLFQGQMYFPVNVTINENLTVIGASLLGLAESSGSGVLVIVTYQVDSQTTFAISSPIETRYSFWLDTSLYEYTDFDYTGKT